MSEVPCKLFKVWKQQEHSQMHSLNFSKIILCSIQIRGKDLVGGVMVMPMGLGDAIKKRTSGEFKMEVCIHTMHALLTTTALVVPYPQPQKHNDKFITKSKSVFSVGICE